MVFFIASLLSYVWRFRHTATAINVIREGFSFTEVLLAVAATATPSSDGSNTSQSSSGILYLPWASRVVIISIFVVAIAHFTLIAIYFTIVGGLTGTEAGTQLLYFAPGMGGGALASIYLLKKWRQVRESCFQLVSAHCGY